MCAAQAQITSIQIKKSNVVSLGLVVHTSNSSTSEVGMGRRGAGVGWGGVRDNQFYKNSEFKFSGKLCPL